MYYYIGLNAPQAVIFYSDLCGHLSFGDFHNMTPNFPRPSQKTDLSDSFVTRGQTCDLDFVMCSMQGGFGNECHRRRQLHGRGSLLLRLTMEISGGGDGGRVLVLVKDGSY